MVADRTCGSFPGSSNRNSGSSDVCRCRAEVLHRDTDLHSHRCVSRPGFSSQILMSGTPGGGVPPVLKVMYCCGAQKIESPVWNLVTQFLCLSEC